MKVIALSKAKANLSHYAKLCHEEPIIVTVHGEASFQLVPLDADDDLIDRLIQHHPKFKKLLAARLREKSVPARKAAHRI